MNAGDEVLLPVINLVRETMGLVLTNETEDWNYNPEKVSKLMSIMSLKHLRVMVALPEVVSNDDATLRLRF